jgi:zinc protease
MWRRSLVFIALLIGLVPTAALAVLPIQHWTLDNGARVYFVQNEALPIVDVRMVFDAGGARDHGLPGLARLTNGLLDQGNAGLDVSEIARRLETVGARLSGGSERDMAWLQLRSLAEPKALEQAVAALTLIASRPDFPEPALQRLRARMLVALQAVKQDPGELGDRALYAAIYRDHPYATPPSGTEESLPKISRDDVKAFYQRYYTAPNSVVAIAGAIDRAQAQQIAQRLTVGLPKGEAAPALPPVAPLEKGPEVSIPFPSSQTHVLLGQPAIDRDSPDIYAFTVGNHILGGSGLVSLLTEAMREQRGLSYSTASYFIPSARPGPFVINTQVRSESADEAIEVLREVFTRMVKKGPTEKELEAAKLNITGSFPLNLDSNGDIVGYLASIGFYDLPLDYLENYVDNIEQVSAQDVQRAFQQHLDPDTLAKVLVGPVSTTAPR